MINHTKRFRRFRFLLSDSDQVEEEEDEGGDKEGRPPVLEPLHGDVLDLAGIPEGAHLHGGEAGRANEADDGRFGTGVITGEEYLEKGLKC